jgi:hypothetical protein
MRAVGPASFLLAIGVAACAATPVLEFVDDGGAGASPPTSTGDDAAASGDGATGSTGDDAAGDAVVSATDASCVPGAGPHGARCCGTVACIGDHCSQTTSCSSCSTLCAAFLYCCANGGNPLTCTNDPNGCN